MAEKIKVTTKWITPGEVVPPPPQPAAQPLPVQPLAIPQQPMPVVEPSAQPVTQQVAQIPSQFAPAPMVSQPPPPPPTPRKRVMKPKLNVDINQLIAHSQPEPSASEPKPDPPEPEPGSKLVQPYYQPKTPEQLTSDKRKGTYIGLAVLGLSLLASFISAK